MADTTSLSSISRRGVLAGAAAVAGTGITSQRASAGTRRHGHDCRTKVVLAGTAGGPPPQEGRLGICTVVVVDERAYIVDLGPSAITAYDRAGLTMEQIRGVFVTHLHSDHLADLYNLFWLNYGPPGARGNITRQVGVYGPGSAGAPPQSDGGPIQNPEKPAPGLSAYFESMVAGTAYDLNARMAQSHKPNIWDVVQPHDIELPRESAANANDRCPDMEPFVIADDGYVRVSATLVDHPPVFPSFAFRFDSADGSVVISGDTAPNDNLIRLAQGADVLVHEVYDHDYFAAFNPRLAEAFERTHTASDAVGRIASEAGVGTLALSHLVPAGIDAVPDHVWRMRARSGFRGEIVVGRDGAEIGVGKRKHHHGHHHDHD